MISSWMLFVTFRWPCQFQVRRTRDRIPALPLAALLPKAGPSSYLNFRSPSPVTTNKDLARLLWGLKIISRIFLSSSSCSIKGSYDLSWFLYISLNSLVPGTCPLGIWMKVHQDVHTRIFIAAKFIIPKKKKLGEGGHIECAHPSGIE